MIKCLCKTPMNVCGRSSQVMGVILAPASLSCLLCLKQKKSKISQRFLSVTAAIKKCTYWRGEMMPKFN